MNSIMKATWYRIRKGKEFKYSLLVVIGFAITTIISAVPQMGTDYNSIIYGVVNNSAFFSIVILLAFNCIVIGSDFRDKTLFYEVMSGHSRGEVFIGRLLVCTIISILLFNILFSVSLGIVFSIISNSYSMTIPFSELFIKILLCNYVELFYIIMFICISFITKNLVSGLAGGWLFVIISWGGALFSDTIKLGTIPISNIMGILSFHNIISSALSVEYSAYILIIYTFGIGLFIYITKIIFSKSELI